MRIYLLKDVNGKVVALYDCIIELLIDLFDLLQEGKYYYYEGRELNGT